jgi:hypothetical protein
MINIADVELINAGSKQQRYPYNYQVDLFLEIDNALIQNTGRRCAGITPNAFNYINTYESEIDTHLHVNTIKLSTLYDSVVKGETATSDALDITLGTCIAYIGVICNSDYG